MHEFSPDENRRWTAWQHANGISARRSDLICRLCGVTMLAATSVALVVALWQR